MHNPLEHLTATASAVSDAGGYWFGITFLVSTFVVYTSDAARKVLDIEPWARTLPVLRHLYHERHEEYVPRDE